MSMTFTKLFSSITESTVWCEPDRVRIVWIAMLAMADSKGRVWASVPGLANRARVPVEDAQDAINRFLSPDPYSRTPDFDGRRIEPIDGGWRLLNHAKYRQIRDDEAAKESKRNYINKRRAAERVENVDQCRTQSNAGEQSRGNAEAYTEAEEISVAKATSSAEPTNPPPGADGTSEIQCPYRQLVDAYHEALPSLPRVRDLGDRRKRSLHSFWRWVLTSRTIDGQRRATNGTQAMEYVRGYFAQAAESDFLMGRTRPGAGHEAWRADIDFLVSEKGKRQVLERTIQEAV